MTDILKAIFNLANSNTSSIISNHQSSNRANQMGEGLEGFVKDMFAGTINSDQTAKDLEYSRTFSYCGNANNPPDFMIRQSDAFEVKKITSFSTDISLNSSHPKDILYVSDPRINKSCRVCEEWQSKDMFYIIGTIPKDINSLKSLWIVEGKCYSAEKETYTKYADKISQSFDNSISDLSFGHTKELGRINKTDPLGITYLRIRGMWGIQHPSKVFSYLTLPSSPNFNLYTVVSEDKFEAFSNESKQLLYSIDDSKLTVINTKVKNPNNTAQFINIKLIHYGL